MKTPSRVVKPVLVHAAPYLALFAAGTVLAAALRLPLAGPAGFLLALVALRVGVMLAALRGAAGQERGGSVEKPARRAALHAAHV